MRANLGTARPCRGTYDVIVFGSGLAGLSVARALARAGRSVAVLEKAAHLGGHLLPFDRGGVRFEVGLHYIADTGPGSAFARGCESLGVALPLVPLDRGFDEFRFGERGVPTHGGLLGSTIFAGTFGEFTRGLGERFARHARALEMYRHDVELAWELSRGLRFPTRTGDYLKAALSDARFARLVPLAGASLRDALENRYGFSPPLVEILSGQHLLMGVPPSELSCLVHFLVHRYYFEGACFVEGGGGAMISALLTPEVDYHTSTQTRLRRGADGLFHVEGCSATGSLALSAHRIVWTPDPRALATTAPDLYGRLSPLTRLRLRSARDPHALTVGYFATRPPLEELGFANRNVWLMGSLDAESCYREFDPRVLAREAPLYVSTGSLRDPGACPEGNKLGARGAFQAMFLCPGDAGPWGVVDAEHYRLPESKGGNGRAYRLVKEETLSILAARLEEAFPALRGAWAWKELGTPLTHGRYLNSTSRSGYGFAATVGDFLWGRPSYVTGIDGLHLCGAHVKPAHGIVTALVNGVGLAERILSWENPRRAHSPIGAPGVRCVEGVEATS